MNAPATTDHAAARTLLLRLHGLTWCDAAHDLADELCGGDPDQTDAGYADAHDEADEMIRCALLTLGFDTDAMDRGDFLPAPPVLFRHPSTRDTEFTHRPFVPEHEGEELGHCSGIDGDGSPCPGVIRYGSMGLDYAPAMRVGLYSCTVCCAEASSPVDIRVTVRDALDAAAVELWDCDGAEEVLSCSSTSAVAVLDVARLALLQAANVLGVDEAVALYHEVTGLADRLYGVVTEHEENGARSGGDAT